MKATAVSYVGREDWLTQRKRGIGGSDAAAILGLNPWKSPMDVYLDKIGQGPPDTESEYAYWGTRLEALVADEFSKRMGLKVARVNALLIHPEHPWMVANIDRRVVGGGILECKTTSEWKRNDWGEDKAPDMYLLQVQHYLAVTGEEKAWLAVLIGGNRFLTVPVERDEALIRDLIDAEARFWECVENRTPPAVDGSDACTEALRRLYPEAKEASTVILPLGTGSRLMSDYRVQLAHVKFEEQELDRLTNEIKVLMGEAEAAYLPGEDKPCATWKNFTQSRFDGKRFSADHPDLDAEYRNQTSGRRFVIK